MEVLHDRAMSSQLAHVVVPDLERDQSGPRPDAEREYLEYRSAVRSMLRNHYPQLSGEWEALYHDAWIELLELRARGDRAIGNPRALLKTIAHRRAVDMLRRRSADPIEPHAPELLLVPDDAVDVDDAAVTKVTADVLHQVIETLEPRQRMVLKLRFDLRMSGSEIEARMGLTRKRLEKIFAETYRQIAEQVEVGESGVSQWSRRQRSLLLACELGIATPSQRARAQDLLARDPQCRVMLRTMRAALRDIAVVLPMPPAALELDDGRRPIAALLDWAGHGLGLLRHPSADVAATRISTSLTEHASGTVIGGLGLGGAVKVAAACLAVGGATAVCLHRADVGPMSQRPERTTTRATQSPAPRPATLVPVVERTAPQPVTGRRVRATRAQLVAAQANARLAREIAVSSPAATPTVSPAPVGATEFDPESGGSGPVASAPAMAPQDGGGEFGP